MSNSKNTHQEIIKILKHKIILGDFPSGEKIPPERKLSASLGVSRGILREVLKAMVAIGFLEIIIGRNGGYMVTETAGTIGKNAVTSAGQASKKTNIEAGLQFRRMFEPKICYSAALNRTYANLEAMEKIIVKFEENLDSLNQISENNWKLHFEIAKATQNKFVVDLLTYLKPIFISMSIETVHLPTHLNSVIFFHKEILAAIKEKNANKAEVIMDTHLAYSYNDIKIYTELNLQNGNDE